MLLCILHSVSIFVVACGLQLKWFNEKWFEFQIWSWTVKCCVLCLLLKASNVHIFSRKCLIKLYIIFCASLQLYVAQYLIWMSPDTGSLLTLVSDHTALNTVLTFLLFVFVSHEMHSLTLSICSDAHKLFERFWKIACNSFDDVISFI